MNNLSLTLLAWGLALAWDQVLGEFPNRLHPVVWMGWCIKRGEVLFLDRTRRWQSFGGLLMLLIIPSFWAWLCWQSLKGLAPYPFFQVALAVFWFKASFALKALGSAAEQVKRNLHQGDIIGAREQLRSLCSRETSHLSEEEVTEAAISSLAENLSDSVIAPWLFAAIGGIPAAMFYRAVNTLDAMVGYKNHYKYLGYCSARFDDLLNLIPARITALLLLAAGSLQRLHPLHRGWSTVREVWAIAWQDHTRTPSPNGGWPMATMAGLLGIQLRKIPLYQLGIRRRASELHVMNEAWQLTQIAAWLGWIVCLAVVFITGSWH